MFESPVSGMYLNTQNRVMIMIYFCRELKPSYLLALHFPYLGMRRRYAEIGHLSAAQDTVISVHTDTGKGYYLVL